ncbi:MAG: hypothetical protein R3E31_04315 [Chloroflexota bacterium]
MWTIQVIPHITNEIKRCIRIWWQTKWGGCALVEVGGNGW